MLLLSFLKDASAQQAGAIAERLAGLLVSPPAAAEGGNKSAAARLRVLVHLYNALDVDANTAEKLAVLHSIIPFAAATRQTELLAPLFATGGAWKAKWGLSDAQARALFLLASSALEKSGDADAAQVFLIRYLSTFEKDTAAIDDEALRHAKDAAVGYVKAPAVSQRSALSQLSAVRGSPWAALRRPASAAV